MPQISVDNRKLLVERVAASRSIGKSARLRDLLIYLCEQVIEKGRQEIHEQEVGHAVFGRGAEYDTNADNIVRVHASMLRKRLEQYFSSEGLEEPVTILLRKGNYAPQFLERTVPEVVETLLPARLPEAVLPPRPAWRLWVFPGLAVLFAALSLFLLVRVKATQAFAPVLSGKPAVREFWAQFFGAGLNTDIVLDDEGVGLFQELTGTHIALSDYFNRNYLRALGADSAKLKLSGESAGAIVLKRQSSYASAALLWKLDPIAVSLGARTSIHFARDYSFRELREDNAILIGNGLSNPWIEAFQERFGLRWRLDRQRGGYYPIDSWAAPDAQDRFRGRSDGYVMVTLLPNLGGSGRVLILSGSGGSAMNAAGDFLADNESVAHLKSLLPQTSASRFPFFEALLRVKSRSRLPRDTAIVFCRTPRA